MSVSSIHWQDMRLTSLAKWRMKTITTLATCCNALQLTFGSVRHAVAALAIVGSTLLR